jgi:hypothetical protein
VSEQVERDALAREDRLGGALHGGQHGIRGDDGSVTHERRGGDGCIEQLEHTERGSESRNASGPARHHVRNGFGIGRDGRLRGDVAGFVEVLGQRRGEKLVDVDAGEEPGRGPSRPPRGQTFTSSIRATATRARAATAGSTSTSYFMSRRLSRMPSSVIIFM